MAELRIKVGAKLTPDFENALRSLRDASARAQRSINDDAVKGGRVRGAAAKAATAEEKRALHEGLAESKRVFRDKAKAEKDAARQGVRDVETAAKQKLKAEKESIADAERYRKQALRQQLSDHKAAQREFVRHEKDTIREMRSAQKQAHAEEAREMARLVGGPYRSPGRTTGGAVVVANAGGTSTASSGPSAARRGLNRVGAGAASFARRLGSEVLSGYGVNADLSTNIHENVALETAATNLSNQGLQNGKAGPNGQRVSADTIKGTARDVGNRTGYSPGAVVGGLTEFTNLTGDLDTGLQSIEAFARLARATGTDLEDMAAAAANVSNQLEDTPDKAKRVAEALTLAASQGKEGAVEIKDLATQMAKVAAAASKFEGDRGANIGILGAFAQEARSKGGAASATAAATSVNSFTNQFGKGARLEGFKNLGIDPYSKANPGQLRSPRAIVTDLVTATHGDPRKMNGAIMDAGAQRVTNGFGAVYRDAFNAAAGGEKEKEAAGLRALNAEMDRLTQSTLKQSDIQDAFARSMNTSEVQATTLNNALSKATGELMDAAIPAIQKLVPAAVDAATAMTAMLKWATGGDDEKTQKEDAETVAGIKGAHDRVKGSAWSSMVDLGADPTDEDIATLKTAPFVLAGVNKRAQGRAGRAHDSNGGSVLDEALATAPALVGAALPIPGAGPLGAAVTATDALGFRKGRRDAEEGVRGTNLAQGDEAAKMQKEVLEELKQLRAGFTNGTHKVTTTTLGKLPGQSGSGRTGPDAK